MTKSKLIGAEYRIEASGDWKHVAQAIKTTKQLIKSTQETWSFFDYTFGDDIKLEGRLFRAYLVPWKGESFADYQQRFVQAFTGTGLKGSLVKFLMGKKVPLSFHLAQNNRKGSLIIDSTARKETYQVTIGASGDYSKRGRAIAEGLLESMNQTDYLKIRYETLDKLI